LLIQVVLFWVLFTPPLYPNPFPGYFLYKLGSIPAFWYLGINNPPYLYEFSISSLPPFSFLEDLVYLDPDSAAFFYSFNEVLLFLLFSFKFAFLSSHNLLAFADLRLASLSCFS